MSDLDYRPEVFNPSSIDDARRIILTPEPGLSTDERWIRETPYLADRLVETMMPDESSLVLDFGCGVGRLAKAVIERSGCTVLGVDISARMRAYAHIYVGSERFVATSPAGLDGLLANGLAVDHAYAVWVLQHCLDPALELRRIHAALTLGGTLCVINSTERWLPTDHGWRSDGKNISDLMRSGFVDVADMPLLEGPLSAALKRSSFFKVLRKAPT